MRPYLLEETYEVLDAIEQPNNTDEHCNELGDLLLQIVFQSQIQKEANHFHIGDVCQAITQKLIRRHPELFDPDHKGPKLSWEEIKEKERQAHPHDRKGLFDSVPKAFPALTPTEWEKKPTKLVLTGPIPQVLSPRLKRN